MCHGRPRLLAATAQANTLRLTALRPRTQVPGKDLEAAIANWDSDRKFYEKATGEILQDSRQRMLFDDMCPERLRVRLRDHGLKRWPTLFDVSRDISDCLAD